jgi:four helix bundle protein
MGYVRDFDKLHIYRTAFARAMEIFRLSKSWPKVENYALTDQIRRSSRSVCANIAEAWGKRRYEANFINKLSTAESEATETITWLDFARACEYLSETDHRYLRDEYKQVRSGLVKMMAAPSSWCGPAKLREPAPPYRAEE